MHRIPTLYEGGACTRNDDFDVFEHIYVFCLFNKTRLGRGGRLGVGCRQNFLGIS